MKGGDAGFTLIELVVVIGVMPIVIGAFAVGIISVFSLQTGVASRLTDSGDAEVVSVHFQNDIQATQMITTASMPQSSPAACGSGFQILGLQLGNSTQLSYTTSTAYNGGTNLSRNVCSGGTETSQILAHDLPSSALTSSPVTMTCASASTPACAPVAPTNTPAYELNWVSTTGVTGVSFEVTEPSNNYTYQVVGVPVASANSVNPVPATTPSAGCGFATPGTAGAITSNLCFVDFSAWNALTSGPPANSNCQSGQLYMSAGITGTAFSLTFCMSVTNSQFNSNCNPNPPPGQTPCAGNPGQGISGYVAQANNGCGVANRAGWDDIDAVALPTYACPPSSEAFLGNNGFFTGVPGDPALYTVYESSTAVISFTNIKVLTTNGDVATNWKLATGDAESTDTNESITWTSNEDLQLIDNSTASPVGNACDSFGLPYAPPNYNTNYLMGVGGTTVECSSTVSEDHTGTPMLQAATPSTLTVTLDGGGLQALFLGVELS
jgi:hypothetical protein